MRYDKVPVEVMRLASSVAQLLLRARGDLDDSSLPAPRRCAHVAVAPFLGGRRGAATISADFELAWAWREWPADRRDQKAVQARLNFPSILRSCEQYGVSITWATVGHLFLEECRCENGTAHPQLRRPSRNPRWSGDWFKHDPCTNATTDPLWYAPDLIQSILDSPVNHEIGCHSFSHIDFSEGLSDEALVESELTACLEAIEPWGLRPRSLVFPFNRMGYHYGAQLARHGILACRETSATGLLAYPTRSPDGLWRIRQSMSLSPGRLRPVVKAQALVDRAIQTGTAFHLWFHPSDDPRLFAEDFPAVLKLLRSRADAGDLWLTTMGGLASYCDARERSTLEVDVSPDATRVKVLREPGGAELTLEVDLAHLRLATRQVARVSLRAGRAIRLAAVRHLYVDVPPDVETFKIDHHNSACTIGITVG